MKMDWIKWAYIENCLILVAIITISSVGIIYMNSFHGLWSLILVLFANQFKGTEK